VTNDIEGWLLPSECAVETYRGDTAYGDSYATSRTVQCAIDDQSRLVRGANGDEQLASTTLRTFLKDASRFTLDSRVTVNGRRTFVIATARRDSAGIGMGDHFEVNLK